MPIVPEPTPCSKAEPTTATSARRGAMRNVRALHRSARTSVESGAQAGARRSRHRRCRRCLAREPGRRAAGQGERGAGRDEYGTQRQRKRDAAAVRHYGTACQAGGQAERAATDGRGGATDARPNMRWGGHRVLEETEAVLMRILAVSSTHLSPPALYATRKTWPRTNGSRNGSRREGGCRLDGSSPGGQMRKLESAWTLTGPCSTPSSDPLPCRFLEAPNPFLCFIAVARKPA